MEYNKNFSLFTAYDFLNTHGLDQECEEIRNSPDKFGCYSCTLRRAKIITLVRDKQLLDDFYSTVWPSGLTDKGKNRLKFFENLVLRFIAEQEGISQEDDEEVIQDRFALEDDLRRYLVKNLSIIEKGLKLYEENGINGEEFFIPGTARRIDILAKDKEDIFVVIELKVNREYDRVVGQALYYQTMIKNTFKQDNVRAIIIAREIPTEVKVAAQFLPDFELFEYQISMLLNKIK